MPDKGRCTLTEKSQGRGGEAWFSRNKTYMPSLSCPISRVFLVEILNKIRVRIEFKKDFIISSKLTNKQTIFGDARNM